jgi:anti-sigma factor RsiW
MMCSDARLLLHAYLDDELDAAQSASMLQHLQSCTVCAASYNDYSRLRKIFAQPELYQRAPNALRQQWVTRKPMAAIRRPSRAWAMAAGVAAAFVLGGLIWVESAHMSWDASSNLLVDEAITGQLRSLQPQHLMDVISTDQHTVKPWFEGKLDFSPTVKDLTREGFPLIGGRLDAIDGHSVAALIYRRRLHIINLYQWPDDSTLNAAQQFTQRSGYTVIRWNSHGMRFLAVSDVNADELKQFVSILQNGESTH